MKRGKAEARATELVEGKALGLRFDDLVKLLEGAGFTMAPARGSSHRMFGHKITGVSVMIKQDGKRELKPHYVKDAAEAILKSGEILRDMEGRA